MLNYNLKTIKQCFEAYTRPNCTFYPKSYILIDGILYSSSNIVHSKVIGVLNLPLTRENNPEYFI